MKKRYIDKINSLFKLEINHLVFSKQFEDHSIIICLKLRTPVLNYCNYHYFQYFIKARELKFPDQVRRPHCLNKGYAKVIEKELKLKLKAMFK